MLKCAIDVFLTRGEKVWDRAGRTDGFAQSRESNSFAIPLSLISKCCPCNMYQVSYQVTRECSAARTAPVDLDRDGCGCVHSSETHMHSQVPLRGCRCAFSI